MNWILPAIYTLHFSYVSTLVTTHTRKTLPQIEIRSLIAKKISSIVVGMIKLPERTVKKSKRVGCLRFGRERVIVCELAVRNRSWIGREKTDRQKMGYSIPSGRSAVWALRVCLLLLYSMWTSGRDIRFGIRRLRHLTPVGAVTSPLFFLPSSLSSCLSFCLCLSPCLSFSVCLSPCLCLSVCIEVTLCGWRDSKIQELSLSLPACQSVSFSVCVCVDLHLSISGCLSVSVCLSVSSLSPNFHLPPPPRLKANKPRSGALRTCTR